MFAPPTSPVFSDRPSGFKFALSCACAMVATMASPTVVAGMRVKQARWSFAIEAESTGEDAVIAIPAKSQRHGAVVSGARQSLTGSGQISFHSRLVSRRSGDRGELRSTAVTMSADFSLSPTCHFDR
jgi:hypothetical protein